ncbi:MAG: SDR family oxidoreductase [Alphaproteobacteria bacterium]|nr:SDR family oxidoreductase [Alphaproteobacteria bacterium]
MRLEGKVAVVTGAASGFGEAIASRFAEEGAAVIVSDINVEDGERVTDTICGAGGRARFIAADVSRDDDAKKMVDGAVEHFGRLDIMVNNAGYTHRNKPMLDVTEDEVDRILAVNVKAIWLAARHCVPLMRAQGGGSILNTASTAGLRPRPGLTVYNASKGGAVIMTKSMAVELAPDNIRVNCLCPVAGETAMLGDFMGEDTPERRAMFQSTIPLGRFSQPDDIAKAALYLSSDEAAFITGVALEVDGGRCV